MVFEFGWLGRRASISALAITFAAVSLCPPRARAADEPCTLEAIRKIAPAGMNIGPGGAIDPPDARLETAGGVRPIPAGALGAGVPQFCFVMGSVVTAANSRRTAHFAAALPPRRAWNRKFMFQGCGSNCGVIYPPSAAALQKGYAVWATDDGHVAKASPDSRFAREDDATWAVSAPGQFDAAALEDFFHRAVHAVTVIGKEFTQRYYAAPSLDRSYFQGCSGGGREAMVELTRYPGDYDGIIAGAPDLDLQSELAATLVSFVAELRSPQAALPRRLWRAASRIILQKCDPEDGVKDGLIQAPQACGFDPYRDLPRCGAGADADACFTAEQIDTLSVIFSAKRNPAGAAIYPGWSVSDIGFENTRADAADLLVDSLGFPAAPGDLYSPQPWRTNPEGQPEGWYWTEQTARYLVYGGAQDFDARQTLGVTFARSSDGWQGMHAVLPDRTVERLRQRTVAGSGADPSAASRFLRAGRKLIMYHGFSDGDVTPYRTMLYFESLAKLNGGMQALQRNARLYVVPGMAHCTDGPGPNNFGQLFSAATRDARADHDLLASLEAWVEAGQAPAAIIATKFEQDDPHRRPTRTMPLCPYPAMARYAGSGDVNEAANWSCPANDTRLLRRGPVGVAAGLSAPLK